MASAAALFALRAHLAKSDYPHKFELSSDISKFLGDCYPTLPVEVVSDLERKESCQSPAQWIIVTLARFTRLFDLNIGPVRLARIVFKPDGKHTLEVLMTIMSTGSWNESQPPHQEIRSMLDTLLVNSSYVLCPDIKTYESSFSEYISFIPKNLRI